jgi:hypothetical protein
MGWPVPLRGGQHRAGIFQYAVRFVDSAIRSEARPSLGVREIKGDRTQKNNTSVIKEE